MSLFITCPVENVERSTAFYTALGWTLNAEMSDHNVSCFAIAPEQYVMLGSREMYASVGGTEELIGGPDTPSKVTVSFDLGSREAVKRGGSDEHRHRDRLAEHRSGQIAARDVHQHPVGDGDAVVGGAVLAQGDLVVSAPRVVVVGLRREPLAGDRLELEDVERLHRAIV